MLKYKFIIFISFVTILNIVDAEEKKIRLEDIEQDNLKNEKEKEIMGNDNYNQYLHQYDVEENNSHDTTMLVYNKYHPTSLRYEYVNINGENQGNKINQYSETVQNIDSSSKSETTASAIPNYGNAIPMQIIYIHQYDNLPNNELNPYPNDYSSPDINHQTLQQSDKTQDPMEHRPIQQDEVKQNYYSNYVTTPTGFTSEQNYLLPLQYNIGIPSYENHNIPVTFIPSQEYTTEHDKNKNNYSPPHSHFNSPSPYQVSTENNIQHLQHSSPKILPQYAKAISQPIYSHISGNLPNYKYSHRENSQEYEDHSSSNGFPDPLQLGFGQFIHRKPTTLLESYIPSTLQIEYLKRGLSKEPLTTYDAVAYSQGFPAKNFETGFLPNQMYTTAEGGVIFGHFKRHVKEI